MYTVAIIMCIVGFVAVLVGGLTLAFSYDSEHIGTGFMVFGAILFFGGIMTGTAEDARRIEEFKTACILQRGVVVEDSKLCISTVDGKLLDIQID